MNIDLTYIIVVVIPLWPIVKTISQIIYKRFEQRLPANINAIIKDYAAMAVRSVEQTGTGVVSNEEKKAVALDIVKKALLAAKLPVPNMAILSAAIEAAVWLLKQEQKS